MGVDLENIIYFLVTYHSLFFFISSCPNWIEAEALTLCRLNYLLNPSLSSSPSLLLHITQQSQHNNSHPRAPIYSATTSGTPKNDYYFTWASTQHAIQTAGIITVEKFCTLEERKNVKRRKKKEHPKPQVIIKRTHPQPKNIILNSQLFWLLFSKVKYIVIIIKHSMISSYCIMCFFLCLLSMHA